MMTPLHCISTRRYALPGTAATDERAAIIKMTLDATMFFCISKQSETDIKNLSSSPSSYAKHYYNSMRSENFLSHIY
eukprot:scaffold203993_cov47-Attheya_sp.AAC.1